MATLTSPLPRSALQRSASRRDRRQSLLLATALTPLTLLLHGYHPYAEDGGIYIAGVEHLLHPELFLHLTEFVLAPTRFSLFAPFVAGAARLAHLTSSGRLPFLIFALHLATIWATLCAASALAGRCWPGHHSRAGAALLVACWFGMPVAGTSLLFMDPYLTARSFSTPCGIAALIGILDATAPDPTEPARRRHCALLIWAGSLACAAAWHPLMAAYAFFATLILGAYRLPWPGSRLLAIASLAALLLASAETINILAPHEQPGYLPVALTRTYWFLARWHWYELIGIAGPVLLLSIFVSAKRRTPRISSLVAWTTQPACDLASAACLCAILITAFALFFCRVDASNHLLAALQPMRGLQFVYLTLFLVLGAWLGENVLRRGKLAWLVAIPLLGGPLFAASRYAAPYSLHLELPSANARNPWAQAFLWARNHTPSDALFALPSNYIDLPGEDAQGFRAVAERSALPDYSKDGGEAAVAPYLADLWTTGQAAQATLDFDSDAARRARLAPLGVTWLVLSATAKTDFVCPFRNAAAKICRISFGPVQSVSSRPPSPDSSPSAPQVPRPLSPSSSRSSGGPHTPPV